MAASPETAPAGVERTLERFLKALRSLGVEVSPDESIEAHRAVALVGFAERAVFRDALAVTLTKTVEEKERFDECFDLFFRVEDLGHRRGDAGAAPDAGSFPEAGAEGAALADLLLAGDRSEIAAAMAAAANAAEVSNIRLFTQRGVYMRRILEAMGLRGLEARIRELAGGGEAERREAGTLEQARAELMEDARDLVERQIALYADPASERLREEFLANARLGNIPPRDFARVRRLVRRMAKRLATRHARRRLNARSGRLDVRRTLRANVSFDGVPFRLSWKHTRLERPKIVTLCDVSGSVAAAAQFLLLFLYSLNEVLSDLRAFAFSSHLEEVTGILDDEDWEQAVPCILEKIGFRPTDYGQTFLDFERGYLDLVDRRTTLVILGDGRNNEGNPRAEILRTLHERAKRVIWLNPEPAPFWGTGDSEMLRYRPYCDLLRVCNTLKHLERVVDDLLTASYRLA